MDHEYSRIPLNGKRLGKYEICRSSAGQGAIASDPRLIHNDIGRSDQVNPYRSCHLKPTKIGSSAVDLEDFRGYTSPKESLGLSRKEGITTTPPSSRDKGSPRGYFGDTLLGDRPVL